MMKQIILRIICLFYGHVSFKAKRKIYREGNEVFCEYQCRRCNGNVKIEIKL